jgi:hypothetical protein
MQIAKKISWILVWVMLFLPMFQTATGMFRVRMVYGEYVVEKVPEFSLEKWLNNKWTSHFEQYVETHVGFRKFFIRLRNQVHYSLFNVSTRGRLIGKEQYLYEKDYIRAMYGKDFRGTDSLALRSVKLKRIIHALNRQNTRVVVVIAPGKASYHPEYFTYHMVKEYDKQRPTNYAVYTALFDYLHIPYIDMRKWFLQMKDTTSMPLFPRMGVHWSVYGSLLAADSLLKYMEHQWGKPVGHISWNHIERSNNYRVSDGDLMELMNLLWDPPKDTMPYPVVQFHPVQKDVRPNVLAVGDSYYWNIMCDSVPLKLFADSSYYWFYNEKAYTSDLNMRYYVTPHTLKKDIANRDFIILFTTEANLYRFPFGVLDPLYQLFYPQSPLTLHDRHSSP